MRFLAAFELPFNRSTALIYHLLPRPRVRHGEGFAVYGMCQFA
jgi:hypothetical protein